MSICLIDLTFRALPRIFKKGKHHTMLDPDLRDRSQMTSTVNQNLAKKRSTPLSTFSDHMPVFTLFKVTSCELWLTPPPPTLGWCHLWTVPNQSPLWREINFLADSHNWIIYFYVAKVVAFWGDILFFTRNLRTFTDMALSNKYSLNT